MSPCGRAVDMLRSFGVTWARMLDGRLTPIRWYRTADDAPALGIETCFGHPVWEGSGEERDLFEGPGCLWAGAEWAPTRLPGCHDYDVIGGVEQFEFGDVAPASPIPRACCAYQVATGGGAVVGGGGPLSWAVVEGVAAAPSLQATVTGSAAAREAAQGGASVQASVTEGAAAGELAAGAASVRAVVGEVAAAAGAAAGAASVQASVTEEADVAKGVTGGTSMAAVVAESAAADQAAAGSASIQAAVAETIFVPLTSFNCSNIAAAGTTQGTAAPIGNDQVRVTGANGTAGVILPSGCYRIVVFNDSAVATLNVYPPVGEAISTLGRNVAASLQPRSSALYVRANNGQWALVSLGQFE
jgi:hypothetical protein